MLITGFGMGLVLQVLILAVQNGVDYKDLGTATSLAAFFRSMGGAFGTALAGRGAERPARSATCHVRSLPRPARTWPRSPARSSAAPLS